MKRTLVLLIQIPIRMRSFSLSHLLLLPTSQMLEVLVMGHLQIRLEPSIAHSKTQYHDLKFQPNKQQQTSTLTNSKMLHHDKFQLHNLQTTLTHKLQTVDLPDPTSLPNDLCLHLKTPVHRLELCILVQQGHHPSSKAEP